MTAPAERTQLPASARNLPASAFQLTLLPAPTPDELRALRGALDLTQQQAAEVFWLASARVWRQLEAGTRRMDRARWTLGLLILSRHPDARVVTTTPAEG